MDLNKYKILECRFLTINDRFDASFNNWSRSYEYPVILDVIDSLDITNPVIHNTACGPDPIHKQFVDRLNLIGSCVHTDIVYSPYSIIYNITKPNPLYINSFDIVLNVSVIEHLSIYDQRKAFVTLLDQVVTGGHFICTFDYPRVDLSLIHELFDCGTIVKPDLILNGSTSRITSTRYAGLSIVLLVIKKV